MCVCGGEGGGGAIFEPKTLSMYLKKKKNKKSIFFFFDRAGIRTVDLRVRKTALLSTRLNTIIAITKYEGENYNIQTAIIQKKII